MCTISLNWRNSIVKMLVPFGMEEAIREQFIFFEKFHKYECCFKNFINYCTKTLKKEEVKKVKVMSIKSIN